MPVLGNYDLSQYPLQASRHLQNMITISSYGLNEHFDSIHKHLATRKLKCLVFKNINLTSKTKKSILGDCFERRELVKVI